MCLQTKSQNVSFSFSPYYFLPSILHDGICWCRRYCCCIVSVAAESDPNAADVRAGSAESDHDDDNCDGDDSKLCLGP